MSAKRVLILSASAGAGHVRAARAIEAAFREEAPEVEVRNVDALTLGVRGFRKAFTGAYDFMVRYMPRVWGAAYRMADEVGHKGGLRRVTDGFSTLACRGLARYAREYEPEAVVCTHFLPGAVLGGMRAAGYLRARLSVVVTDYAVHEAWIARGVDRYFVATEEMEAEMSERGAAAESVKATGIPIMPAFARAHPSKAQMRAELGVRIEGRTVLMMAGSFGTTAFAEVVQEVIERAEELQVLAVAGRNERIYEELTRLARRREGTVAPYRFVENMDELMAASDVAVGKSGGLTTSECLASGLPLVVYRPIPGQEECNAEYLVARGAGVRVERKKELSATVARLLAGGEELARMSEAGRGAGKPLAAKAVVGEVMGAIS